MSHGSALDVVGIGSMVVDRIHRTADILGPEEKGFLSPLAGGAPWETFVGGVVLNHLGWAAALGLRCGIFGRQADDENGRFLRAAMDRLGIARDIHLDGDASSVAQIFVDDAGGRSIYMAPGATAETTGTHVRERHANFIARATCLSTEVSQLPLDAVLEALTLARGGGLRTVLDLDLPPSQAVPRLGDTATLDSVLRAADVLKPAKAAARELVGSGHDDALSIARQIRERYECGAVIVTDGAAGCAIAAADFEGAVAGNRVDSVIDTTGAGDAFLGGLLVALRHELGWEHTGALANACGAACVERLGAFPEDTAAARARVLELYEGPLPALSPLPAETPDEAVDEARRTLAIAVEELASLCKRTDARALGAAAELILESGAKGGRVHVTGVGKPEHVARYGASLLASTGTPAVFLHATEALHGSLGQVVPGDVVIAISNSGETAELLACALAVRGLGARVVAVTGATGSALARLAEVVLDAGVAREGGGLGLVPRASVAAEVLVLASLSALLETRRGFTRADYHARHPAGKLGAKSKPKR